MNVLIIDDSPVFVAMAVAVAQSVPGVKLTTIAGASQDKVLAGSFDRVGLTWSTQNAAWLPIVLKATAKGQVSLFTDAPQLPESLTDVAGKYGLKKMTRPGSDDSLREWLSC